MEQKKIKLLDCTIRDGGLMNKSQFNLKTVRAVYRAACLAGIDYIELGYRNSKIFFSPAEYGPWRFCDEDQLRKVVEGTDNSTTKIAIMQDAHKAVPEDILPNKDSVVDMIRIATYVRDIDKAIDLTKNASEKNYECTINIMAISQEKPAKLDHALQQVDSQTEVDAVYIVDSYGALYPEDVQSLILKYKKFLNNKKIGVHFHNHQQLAFANTIAGIKAGVDFIDGTLLGLGRAAGNCPIELLVGYLKDEKLMMDPLLDIIQEEILPLREKIEWGYQIPYMLSGLLNRHPREAIEWMKSAKKSEFNQFYKNILGQLKQS